MDAPADKDVRADTVGKSQDEAGHSDIFTRLAAKDDLIGLVAYGVYQRRKRTWMDDFRKECGRYPDWPERRAYAFGHRQDAIDALKDEAESILGAFAQKAIDDRAGELQAEALGAETRSVLRQINTRITKLGGYGHAIIGHVLGFITLVGLVVLLALALRFEPTLEKAYQWITSQPVVGH